MNNKNSINKYWKKSKILENYYFDEADFTNFIIHI